MKKYIFSEELKYNLAQPLIYVFAILFAFIGVFHFSNSSTSWNGLIHIGAVHRNSAFLVTKMLLNLSVLGVFAIFIPLANSVQKDFTYTTYPFIFTTGLQKKNYIFGRFFGAFLAVLLIFIVALIGIFLGSFFTSNQFLGKYKIGSYLFPFLMYVIPNVFLLSTIFFAIGTLKKRVIVLYITAIILLLYLFILQGFTGDVIRNQTMNNFLLLKIMAFADPLGNTLFQLDTAQWTLVQKNTETLPFSLELVLHRMFWIGVGVYMLKHTFLRFNMEEPTR